MLTHTLAFTLTLNHTHTLNHTYTYTLTLARGKHLIALDKAFLEETVNVILIREPQGLMQSYLKAVES